MGGFKIYIPKMVNYLFDQTITLLGTFAHILLLAETFGLPNDNLKKVIKAKPLFLFAFMFLFAKINNAEKYLFVTFVAALLYFIMEYETILNEVKKTRNEIVKQKNEFTDGDSKKSN
ncbi:MAG: hypothetical protein CMB64_04660 [Euryarchaeota archaeon]|nr:hypothetical protein [Euryarchaeota archaeon]